MPTNSTTVMDIAPSYGNNSNHRQAYEKTVSLDAAGYSAAILIPQDVSIVSVSLVVASGGTGIVQTTTDSITTVKTGTVSWIDWPSGTVAVNTTDVCYPVTAVRCQQVHAGTVSLSVRAQ